MSMFSENLSKCKHFKNNVQPRKKGVFCAALLTVTLFVTALGAPAMPSEDESNAEASTEQPPQGVYFCAINNAIEGIDGLDTFSAKRDYFEAPSRSEFPRPDREFITEDGYTEDSRYYWYIKTQPFTFGTYTIHGVFDFETLTLNTSRSMISHMEGGGIGTVATSFEFLCSILE